MAATGATSGSNFNEDKVKPFTAEDVRFTTKGRKLYAFVMGAPETAVRIQSLGTNAGLLGAPIAAIRLLGSDEKLTWSQAAGALTIEAPHAIPDDIAVVFEITPRE